MAVSVQPKIAGLDVLETGIRTLKRSKLIVTPEFKDMLCAVERHHNDLKLAHLTGKAKDLVDQAQRDTKFYNILVKMLCEIKEKRTGEQRQGLRRVYTWYRANKHILYSGPHFGKEQMKKEAKEILVKASTPRKAKGLQSTRWGMSQSRPRATPDGNRSKSAPSVRIREHGATWRDSSFDWRKDLDRGVLSREQPKVERLQLEQENDNREDDNDYEAELQNLGVEADAPLNTATTANSELLREAHMLSRAHHGSPNIMTPLGEQSPNVEASPVTPRKVVHPISSMVNPHAALAAQLDRERQEKLLAQHKVGKKASRADNLQAWQNFTKDRSYGQDIIDRLNFVGRSGTPNDVRYFSHREAEMPELYTQDIITGYAHIAAAQHLDREEDVRDEEQKENIFLQQTLEEFYQTADALYPQPPKEAPPGPRVRVKSAPSSWTRSSQPSRGEQSGAGSPSRKAVTQPNKLGHMLGDLAVEEVESTDGAEKMGTAVKLDTVVNIIDSVSEGMTLFKERLAPEAQPGFRQPTVTGLHTSGVCPSPARLPSPSARSNSPVHSQMAAHSETQAKPPRPYSSPLVTRNIGMGEEVCTHSTSPQRTKDRCKSASVVDWRGRVQPDTMRYKWGKTKFGGFTYLKKHQQKPVNLRSAGATSAGSRPKTAPLTMREKWKTEKVSDENKRVEAQAASNSMTQINQQDVDNMVSVQYLLGSSNSRADSLASLYTFDEDVLRSLRRSANVPVDAPLEFVSFVAPSPAGPQLAERRSQAQDHRDTSEERTRKDAGEEESRGLLPDFDDLHLPIGFGSNIAEDDSLTGDVGDDDNEDLHDHQAGDKGEVAAVEQQEVCQESEGKEDLIPEGEDAVNQHLPANASAAATEATEATEAPRATEAPQATEATRATEAGVITQVAAISPATPRNKSPRPASQSANRPQPQPLNLSQVWQFTTAQDGEEEEVKLKPGFILGPSTQLPPQKRVCAECGAMASMEAAQLPKVERSAGRMPGQAFSASAQMGQLARRHAELMRRAPPPRTPPSIPLPKAHSLTKGRSPRSGPMLAELEHHARKVHSPRSFMQHVKNLRSSFEGVRDISTAPSPTTESLMGTLQVCRLNVPLSRQRSLPSLFSDDSSSQEGLHSILKQPLDVCAESNLLQSIDETGDNQDLEKMVTFSHAAPLVPLPQKPATAPAHVTNGLRRSESLGPLRQVFSGQGPRGGSLHSSRSSSLHSSRSSLDLNPPSTRSLARIGRPIAQVAQIPDPDEVAFAVQIQKEAAAAVDIQRLFRGYVARNEYKKLLSEERKRLEDRQRAALEIQRAYRGHLYRKQAIEKRPPDPEMLEWAHNYRTNLMTREQQRRVKVEERAEELSDNFYCAHSKLSVIGPHVNIYEIYHPKKTGPTRKELSNAATLIQRHIRGWLVRRRFDKLHRKAAWYGSTFPKMVKEYKAMLIRVQRQHGVERPLAPFTTKDMNDYIDTRRRYESVFEKKAFGGELELGDLDSFFKECDLYPSQAEIEEAMKATIRGDVVARHGRGLKRHEILEVVFYIYTPRASGLEHTRRSTWMNPIIDGVEARRLLGSEFVEEAPLEVCARLVINTKREQREKEQAAERARKDEEAAELRERLGLPHPKEEEEEDEEEERKRQKKMRRVTLAEPRSQQ